jgi:uncharacterized protein
MTRSVSHGQGAHPVLGSGRCRGHRETSLRPAHPTGRGGTRVTQSTANDDESQRPHLPELAQVAFRAVIQGNVRALVRVLDAGLPVDLDDQTGNTLLMLAGYHGRPEATAVLLERGADPNRTNLRGHTPLCGAALRGDARSALLLLERGARVDQVGDDGRTPLMLAAMFDRADVVVLLLEAGADASRTDRAGRGARELAQTMGVWRTQFGLG